MVLCNGVDRILTERGREGGGITGARVDDVDSADAFCTGTRGTPLTI